MFCLNKYFCKMDYLQQKPQIILSRFLSSNIQRQLLPRLPVPPLQQTLEKYLQTVEPHLNSLQFDNTKNIVKEFGQTGGIGEKLQNLLLRKYNETENWLADWWLKYSYLAFRQPLIVYSSPGMVLPKFECKSVEDMILVAARIILAAVNYKHIVDEDRLPQEMMGKAALDMTQHGLMLGTCRIPKDNCDTLTYLSKTNLPKHVIVVHNNQYVKVDVYDELGRPYAEPVLIDLLKDVINKTANSALPLGVLTAENRDVWAKAYKELRQS